jgi:hypothetical protein
MVSLQQNTRSGLQKGSATNVSGGQRGSPACSYASTAPLPAAGALLAGGGRGALLLRLAKKGRAKGAAGRGLRSAKQAARGGNRQRLPRRRAKCGGSVPSCRNQLLLGRAVLLLRRLQRGRLRRGAARLVVSPLLLPPLLLCKWVAAAPRRPLASQVAVARSSHAVVQRL